MTESLIKIAEAFIHWKSIKQTDVLLSTTEIKYIAASETAKNVVITHKILHKLSIISEDFVFLLLINNTSTIAVSENEKVTRNARHIDIWYHHIRDLVEKKIIEISHISTGRMTVNDLTKTLLSNKFKEFIELIEILKIEASGDSKTSNGESSNSESNNSKPSGDKNNGNLVANYYKAGEEADEEVSFEAEEAE